MTNNPSNKPCKWLRRVTRPTLFLLLILPASTNYQLRDYGFGSGGERGLQSTNYQALVISGEIAPGQPVSSNNIVGGGLIFTNQANVPAAPTVANDSNYTTKLHLTINPGSEPSDATYEIAISPDNFVTTTNYVQSDNTMGATAAWQSYATWGGASGFLVLGLAANTTYTVKLKAREGNFTDTAFSPTANATTSVLTISFSVGGVASGTSVAGVTTDVTTTNTAIPFGEIPVGSRVEAAQQLTVSTSAASGYTTRINQVGALVSTSGVTFPAVTSTNASPAAWPGSVTTGAYGYHTTDATLGTGTTTRFSSNTTFAQIDTTPREIAFSSGPVDSEVTSLVFAIQAGPAQPAGQYTQTLTYTVYGVF